VRTRVLLERDLARLAEVALELEDVADVGSAEGVDRLVRIADGEDVLVLGREQLQQPVLGVVRVLVLVDQHVAEGLLPALARLGEALEHLHGQVEQVVEVERARLEELALIKLVHLGDGAVVEGGYAGHELFRADEPVLGVRDLGVDAARREALGIALQLLEADLDQADLVGLVVDGEAGAVAEARNLRAQDAAAGSVEGHDPGALGFAAEQRDEARAHLRRRPVGEGDGQDLVRLDAAGAHQVSDPVGEHPRLARARARDDEQRPFGRHDGVALRLVQLVQVVLG
jgi:hypothetical protein